MDDLFDELLLLSPEQVNYNKGLEEGLKISYKRNEKQGKEYGLMIGFQKFLIVGQLEEILSSILRVEEKDESNGQFVRQCRETLGMLDKIEMNDNESDIIERNDAILMKVKNKVRLILMVYNKKHKKNNNNTNLISFDSIIDVYNQVGNGELPTNKIEDYYAEESDGCESDNSNNNNNKQTNLVNGMNTDW